MTERLLDISESPAYLHVENAQLVIEREGRECARLPLTEAGAVVLTHPQVVCTLGTLAGLMEAGGAVVVCGRQHSPVGLLLPTTGHFSQAQRFALQAAAPLPLRKRLWQQVVRAKIRAQAALLSEMRGTTGGLLELAGLVRSGDPANIEARAARVYWPLLFADDSFHRRRDAEDANRLLNYGYAVLRGLVGRAICAVGLHPSIGLHHHNRYDPFCLADDLMEPYRPLVDAAAVEHVGTYGKDVPMDRAAKEALLGAMAARYAADGEARTLFDILGSTASSLAKVFLREAKNLWFPGRCKRAGC